ncbi:MAG: hypothetical protein GWO24_27430 [Akkermansiaceae bacterium]|nr:hypothetical protein [Akkermansiaceae bacterium]
MNIPARFNATGKRSRPTFKTRRAAEHYAKDLRESERSYEASSKRLRPSEIEDAQLACQQLEGLGVNLPVI